ncbi:MAG: hypothetical protein ACXAEU_08330 [Candidatus Hodarchaeales archaeon]
MKREVQIISDLDTQPLWFRIIKFSLMISTFLFFTIFFDIMAAITWLIFLVTCGFFVHFFYRWKTNAWTRSWGMWIASSNDSGIKKRNRWIFYLLFLVPWILTTFLCTIIFSL